MNLYNNQIIEAPDHPPIWPWLAPTSIEDAEFRGCRIKSCSVLAANPRRRPHVRGVRLLDSEVNVTLQGAVVEEVFVDSLRSPRRIQTWATVFKHVTLRGNAGDVMIRPFIDV